MTPEFEDRGTPYTLWILPRDHRSAEFVPIPRGQSYTVSVPIGWSLKTDPVHGVVLVSTFGEVLRADQVFHRALNVLDEQSGFRFRVRPEGGG